MSSLSEESDTFFKGEYNDYSISYYEYFTNEECTGFGWDLSNHTKDDLEPCTVHSKDYFILATIIQPLIAVFGTIGIIAFLFIVWKEPHMRNNMNLILVNLAIADLLYLLVGTGEKFVNALTSPVTGDSIFFGRIFQCFFINTAISVGSFTSLLLVSFLSLERYVAVCKPMKRLRISSRKRTLRQIGLTWFFAILLAVGIGPIYFRFSTVCMKWPNETIYSNYPKKAAFCEPLSDVWLPISEMVDIIPYFVALLLNSVCFVRIISKLYDRKVVSLEGGQSYDDDSVAALHRNSAHAATRMLLINGIAFFILATPYHVTNAIQFFEHIFKDWVFPCTFYKDLSITLLYLNSAVNPYIYGVTNKFYRKAYGNIFCKRLPQGDKTVCNTVATELVK